MGHLHGRAWRSFLAVLLLAAGLVAWASKAAAIDYGIGPLRIGPDDVLVISVWDEPLDQVVTVRPDGKISLPLVGETEAGGMTVAELASRLTTMYRRLLPRAQVTVGIKEIRSRHVFFLGRVLRPGPIQLTEDLSLLQALAAVGGPVPTADLESVFVLRGWTRIPVNVRRMLQGADLAQNFRLQPRDTVVVPAGPVCAPSIDCVLVQGAVRSPGAVRYTKDLTIGAAIAAAGGFTLDAGRVVARRCDNQQKDALLVITPNVSPSSVPAVRSDAPMKEGTRINLPANVMSCPVEPNDVIHVPHRLF